MSALSLRPRLDDLTLDGPASVDDHRLLRRPRRCRRLRRALAHPHRTRPEQVTGDHRRHPPLGGALHPGAGQPAHRRHQQQHPDQATDQARAPPAAARRPTRRARRSPAAPAAARPARRCGTPARRASPRGAAAPARAGTRRTPAARQPRTRPPGRPRRTPPAPAPPPASRASGTNLKSSAHLTSSPSPRHTDTYRSSSMTRPALTATAPDRWRCRAAPGAPPAAGPAHPTR